MARPTRPRVLADSPRAYWRLGEASATTAADASGNNRTGSYLNTPSFGAPGALTGDSNSAVSFNGVDEHVNVPYLAALNPTSFTVEAWAYPTGGQGTFRSIVTSRDYAPGAAKGYVLYAAPDNTWQLWTGSGGWNVVYGPSIVLNQWTHLVGTYNGTTLSLYVNGVLVSSNAVSYTQNTTRPLRIAAGRSETRPPATSCPDAWTRSPCTARPCRRRGCRRITRPAPDPGAAASRRSRSSSRTGVSSTRPAPSAESSSARTGCCTWRRGAAAATPSSTGGNEAIL